MARRLGEDYQLSRATRTTSLSAQAALVPFERSAKVLKEVNAIEGEGARQGAVIAAIRAKAIFGVHCIGEVTQHSEETFDDMDHSSQVIEEKAGRNPKHQGFVEQVNHNLLDIGAQQIMGMTEVAAVAIARVVAAGVEPPPEPPPPPPKRGWFS